MSSSGAVAFGCRNHPDVHDRLERCARCQDQFCEDCLASESGQLLCATCKHAIRVQGSGVSGLPHATIFARAMAQMIDGILILVVFYGTLSATGGIVDYFLTIRNMSGWTRLLPILSGHYLYYALPLSVLNIVYEATMLQIRSQTPGKMLMGIRVAGVDGGRVRAGEAWRRAIARTTFAHLFLLIYVDYLAVFYGRDRATLHDRVAGTRVVVS